MDSSLHLLPKNKKSLVDDLSTWLAKCEEALS